MMLNRMLITQASGTSISSRVAIVQLGKAAGKKMIGLVDTDEKVEFVLANGGDGAVNNTSEDVTEAVRRLTGGAGVDLILDSIGGAKFADHFDRLAPFGLIVSYGQLDGTPQGDVLGAMTRRMGDSLGLRMFSMHMFDEDRERRRTATEKLIDLVAAGSIQPVISVRLPLAQAGRAHAMMESGEILGKLVLKP